MASSRKQRPIPCKDSKHLVNIFQSSGMEMTADLRSNRLSHPARTAIAHLDARLFGSHAKSARQLKRRRLRTIILGASRSVKFKCTNRSGMLWRQAWLFSAASPLHTSTRNFALRLALMSDHQCFKTRALETIHVIRIVLIYENNNIMILMNRIALM